MVDIIDIIIKIYANKYIDIYYSEPNFIHYEPPIIKTRKIKGKKLKYIMKKETFYHYDYDIDCFSNDKNCRICQFYYHYYNFNDVIKQLENCIRVKEINQIYF